MKAWPFVVLVIVFVAGCGHRDLIDRIVKQESANPFFGSGLHSILYLPTNATPDQLISVVLKQDFTERGRMIKVLETKKVRILPKGLEEVARGRPDLFTYTAVFVDTDDGQKVFLFQYDSGDDKNKVPGGWWYEVYDQ